MSTRNRKGQLKVAPVWLGVGLAATVALAAAPANAYTLFGDPTLLSPGQFKSLPFTLFGEQVTPRLDVDGFVRYLTTGQRISGKTEGFMSPEVDIDVNLQLTATQRIHGLWRPLERGFRDPIFDQFQPDEGWTVRTSGEPERLWYEGQPLNWLTPGDSFPLDISVAGGRVPLYLHNGLWFDNSFDGIVFSKNNIQLGTLSNLNVLYFLSRGQPHGGAPVPDSPIQTNFNKAEARKNVTGLYADADWYEYFIELSWAYSYDNGRGPLGVDLNRNFWGLSVTRTFGYGGLSFRVLGSSANATRGAGALFVLEGEKEFLGVRGYGTAFWGMSDWLPVSQEGVTMSREGILFTFDRLVETPGLISRGYDSRGGAFGVIFNPRGIITFTPEVGFVLDTSRQGNDQFGAALQIQADLASLLIPGTALQDVKRRGVLYGAYARLTIIEVHNENNGVSQKPDDYGARMELVYRF